jgi:hypothetical protein
MKRISILLFLGLSMFFVSNANANFIGTHSYPVIFQNVSQNGFHPFQHFNFLKYRGSDWPSLSRLGCRRDCSEYNPPGDGGSAAVPEPSTILLTLMGLVGLGVSRRKRQ